MRTETAASDAGALRDARIRLIKTERARQRLTQDQAADLVNHQLQRLGYPGISRPHFSKIENGRRNLTEATLRAISAALGIREAELRNPTAELWAA